MKSDIQIAQEAKMEPIVKIAEKLNLISIDTGAMYRCVALECLNNNVKEDEVNKIEKIFTKVHIKDANAVRLKAKL